MKLQLLVGLCWIAPSYSDFGGRYAYRVSEVLDEALVQFNSRVTNAGDDSLDFEESIGVGGFVMHGPKLMHVATLKRTGDAWLVPLNDAVEVFANFSLKKMQVDGERLLGPGQDVNKPRIIIRENLIAAKLRAQAETTNIYKTIEGDRIVTKRCQASYRPSVTNMSSVVMVTNEGVSSLDLWVRGLFSQIAEYLEPVFQAIFEKHFDLCDLLRKKGYKLSKTGGDF